MNLVIVPTIAGTTGPEVTNIALAKPENEKGGPVIVERYRSPFTVTRKSVPAKEKKDAEDKAKSPSVFEMT